MLTITAIPNVIRSFYNAGSRATVVFRSQPGIGKTDQVREAAKVLAAGQPFGFIEEHLASRSEVDLRGYLIPNGENAQYTKPDFWKVVEQYDRGILFLDELFQCSVEMQKAIAPLLLDHRIGDYTLPPGWMVVGATNGVEHRSGVTPALSHVVNRICLIDVAPPTPEELAAYYVAKDMPAEIIALTLRSPATVLGTATPVAQGTPWCSPRSLERAGRVMKSYPSPMAALSSPAASSMIQGYIGQAAFVELQAIAKLADALPHITDIIADPMGTRVPDTVDKQWLAASMLGLRTTMEQLDPVFQYLTRFPANIAFIGLYSCWQRGITAPSAAVTKWVAENDALLAALTTRN